MLTIERKNNKAAFFLQFWLLFFFITSIVVFPNIKGTTPAFILSFLAIPVSLLISRYQSLLLLQRLFITVIFVFLWFFFSQLLIFSFSNELGLDSYVVYISEEKRLLFRSSFFTQFLYLLASLIIFYYVSIFYKADKHDSFIYYGAVIVTIYGFFELFYFWITGEFGDFLSNRTFGDGKSGSLLQTFSVGSFTTQRFKSLTGEPSMYVFSLFPVFVYAYYDGKKKIAYFILASLLFTFSTSFFIGIAILFSERLFRKGLRDKFVFYSGLLFLLALILFFKRLTIVFDKLVVQKIEGTNISGIQRIGNFTNHIEYFIDLPFPSKLFGLGFGYVRSTDFFSTLLVNVGILGFFVYSVVFLYPILKLGSSRKEKGLKVILFFIYLVSIISVPEFSYPSAWLFLGISYNLIKNRTDGNPLC